MRNGTKERNAQEKKETRLAREERMRMRREGNANWRFERKPETFWEEISEETM